METDKQGTARWRPLPDSLAPETLLLVERLRALKQRTGLSLVGLATRTAYSKSAWHRYLNGVKFPPRTAVEALGRLAGTEMAPLLTLWEEACRAETGPLSEASPPPAPQPQPQPRPGTRARLRPGTRARRLRRTAVVLAAFFAMLCAAVYAAVCAVDAPALPGGGPGRRAASCPPGGHSVFYLMGGVAADAVGLWTAGVMGAKS
jgi:hypothetical protein